MIVPTITATQFLVLKLLERRESSGHNLRVAMSDRGVKIAGPRFYQAMARMEELGLVVGRYEPKVANGVATRERYYEITTEGLGELKGAYTFYAGK